MTPQHYGYISFTEEGVDKEPLDERDESSQRYFTKSRNDNNETHLSHN